MGSPERDKAVSLHLRMGLLGRGVMKTMYILRGPSGAGKGHYIRNRLLGPDSQAIVCSADDFFMRPVTWTDECGVSQTDFRYEFDVSKLPKAHADCMGRVLQAMMLGHETIVVDNTHTRRWEYLNYERAGRLAGYEVNIIEIVPRTIDELRLCARRNVHGVPASAIASMMMRFEPDTRAVRVPMNGWQEDGKNASDGSPKKSQRTSESEAPRAMSGYDGNGPVT